MAKHSKNKKPKHVSAGNKIDSSELETSEKPAAAETAGKQGDSQNADCSDDSQNPDHSDSDGGSESARKDSDLGEEAAKRSEKPSKPEKPGKADKASKSEKTSNASDSDKSDDSGKTDKTSKSDNSDRFDKTGKSDKLAKGGKHAAVSDAAADDKKKKLGLGKKPKGKHSAGPAPKEKQEQPIIQSVPMPAQSPQDEAERAEKRRRRLKRTGIGIGAAAAVCLIAYLGGALFFATHYLPNTEVAGIDISLKTPEEMQSLLNESVDEYSLKVVGNGLNFTITADEADISADSAAASEAVLKTTNIWAWPLFVFSDHDLTSELSNAISADKLSDVVNAEVEKINSSEGATMPIDAHVAYNKETHVFEVVAETMGTMLNPEEVMNQVITGVLNLQPKVTVLSDALVQPEVFSNDKRLDSAAERANEMIKANVEVTMDGFVVTKVSPDVSSTWVTFTPEIEAEFSSNALASWAEDVASMCNTVGAERTYTRPDGKEITVSGGVYGWEVDSSGLADQIIEAVKSGETTTIEIPVIQSGTGFKGLGGQDWGNRYVDVDLSEQYARFYGDDGGIIWEADIVSGKPGNGHATPPGVWWVNRKASPSKLIGEMKDGKPEYETTVQYWMPFQGNSIGFHDATWQPYFGGSLYLTNGSHGCINLSYSDAQSLYGILSEGDVVVVHY